MPAVTAPASTDVQAAFLDQAEQHLRKAGYALARAGEHSDGRPLGQAGRIAIARSYVMDQADAVQELLADLEA